ncbi:MAG: VWA-like domain-containing protein [Crocinitomicaceae bacterium]
MSTQVQNLESTFSSSVIKLLRQESFYAHVISSLTRVFVPQIETLAVSFKEERLFLSVNPDFFINKLSENERIGVLKHEVLHILFKHLFRGNRKDPFLENVAADLVVNQYVDPWPLPEGALLLIMFPELNLLKGQTMEYYYNELLKLSNPNAQELYPISMEALNACSKNIGSRGIHDFWSSSSSDRTINRVIKEAKGKSLDFGNLPLDVQRAIDLTTSTPKISWKQILRLFNSSCGRTVLRSTRRKESKRFEGNPGSKIKKLKRIVVAIDTSGSINTETLSLFWNEVQQIYRTGTTITIIECDAQIQATYELRKSKVLPTLKGGGGTNFNPVIEWVNQQSVYTGLIYFTDGYGPNSVKCKVPVLWCVYGPNESTDHLKGRVLRLID